METFVYRFEVPVEGCTPTDHLLTDEVIKTKPSDPEDALAKRDFMIDLVEEADSDVDDGRRNAQTLTSGVVAEVLAYTTHHDRQIRYVLDYGQSKQN